MRPSAPVPRPVGRHRQAGALPTGSPTARRRRTQGAAVLAAAALAVSAAGCSRPPTTSRPPVTTAPATGPTTGPTTSPTTGPTTGPAPAASAGCGTSQQPGSTTARLRSGADQRTYVRHVPRGYDGRTAVPLVIDFHGFSSNGGGQENVTGFGAYGDTKGYVTLSPNGLGTPPYWDTQLDSRDLRFVGDLLDEAERTLCLDKNRIYVAGFSNGAFLASSVACVYADRVAAVAPVGGARDPRGCQVSRPLPLVSFHGTADTYVKYTGGLGSSTARLPAPDGSGRTLGQVGAGGDERFVPASFNQAVEDVAAAWARRDGCSTPPATAAVTASVTRIAYTCPGGVDVQLYRVAGAGHTWPGTRSTVMAAGVFGPVNRTVNATEVIWDFFTRHPLRRG